MTDFSRFGAPIWARAHFSRPKVRTLAASTWLCRFYALAPSVPFPGFGNEFGVGGMIAGMAVLQALALARRSRGAGSSNISQQTSRSTPHVGMQEAHVAQPQILRKHH